MAEPGQARAMWSKLSLVAFLFLVAGTHAVDPVAPAASGDGPADPAPQAGSGLQPTRESIYRHLAAELQHALGAEEHIKGVFAGLAAGVSDSITASVMPSLQALIDSVVERAEDAWIAADDAGRTVQVKECVDGAEYDAQQVAKRAVEKMRGCVESLEQEGARRAREAARLLSEIDRVSKRLVAALETCVSGEVELQAAADADPSAAPADADPSAAPANADPSAVPANPVDPAEAPADSVEAPEAPAAPATAAEDTSACTKDSAEGSTPCSCPKCKKSKAKESLGSQEQDTAQAEPKRKCKGGQKCEKGKEAKDFKKGEKLPGGEKPKKEDRGKDQVQEKNQESATTEEGSEEAGTGEEMKEGASSERTEKQSKGEKKNKYTKEEKVKGKTKKGKKEESPLAEEQSREQQSEKYKSNEGKKKNKKTEGMTKDAETKESKTPEQETNEKSNNNKKNVEGKYKKEKGEIKEKGKKKTQEVPSEGKGRRKRDLLAVQENPDESDAVGMTSEESAQPTESESLNAVPQWPTEGSNAEEKIVIACLQTPVLKPLMEEKTRVYHKLQGMLKRVQEKQQDAPACVLEHVRKAEAKINAIKARMASCAERRMREEL